MSQPTLYERLGGYDGITAFVDDLLPRLKEDALLGRFWEHRGEDGIAREKQLLIDYLCASAGGSMLYKGRGMKQSHKGMRISENDWNTFLSHAGETMAALAVPEQEANDIAAFVNGLKGDIVEA